MILQTCVCCQTVDEKETLDLSVTVTGVPEPDVKWYRNDVEFQPTLKVKISSEEDGLHRLTVTSVTPTMTGDYKVIASNSAGQAEHLATVTVTGET